MTLLVLDSVTKRYSTDRREHVALRDVSLDIAPGELVAVWGTRHSGRTTLLRVASGMEPPDSGIIRFDGHDLCRHRADLLGREIAYANRHFMAGQGGAVVDHVAVGLLAQAVPRNRARARAFGALERVGAADLADLEPRLLDPAEAVRVGLARALITRPRLLLIDDPTNGVDLLQRDPLLHLIRSIPDDGAAVLMTIGEAVTVADRVLTIDRGELRGDTVPTQGQVVPLRTVRAEPAG